MPVCYIHNDQDFHSACVQVHHRIPQAYGGLDTPENRFILCSTCHDFCHRMALKLAAGQRAAALDAITQYLPNSPARQKRFVDLCEAIVRARFSHKRSLEIPEAGLDTDSADKVLMSLEVPAWLHHRLKSLAGPGRLYKYVLGVLNNHAMLATQKSGASRKELFGDGAPISRPTPPNIVLNDPTR